MEERKKRAQMNISEAGKEPPGRKDGRKRPLRRKPVSSSVPSGWLRPSGVQETLILKATCLYPSSCVGW